MENTLGQSEITEEVIRQVYQDLADYEYEIIEHNNKILHSIAIRAKNDFKNLLDFCNVTGKIEFVDKPIGTAENENFGVFRNIHVDQRSVGCEGDSFEGFIYANLKDGRWLKIPYSC